MENAKFVIDDICNDDYGLILVPKVVSYDAALLNYFFRGTLEISLPDDGVYAVADPQSPDGFTKIRLKVKNTTGNNELMTDGTIRAVIRYQLAQTDPFQNHPVEISQETSYAISSSINLASLSTGSVQDITFDLPPNSLPFRATNVLRTGRVPGPARQRSRDRGSRVQGPVRTHTRGHHQYHGYRMLVQHSVCSRK